MRHRIKGRRLGRTTAHRRSLGRNLISALFLHGRIVTTGPKAKEYRPIAEKLITLGRERNLSRVRRATAALHERAAVTKLFDEIGPSFRDRPGGYTRIVKLPRPRLGDKGSRVFLELVTYVPPAPAPTDEKGKAKASPEGESEGKAGRSARGSKAQKAGKPAGKKAEKKAGKAAQG